MFDWLKTLINEEVNQQLRHKYHKHREYLVNDFRRGLTIDDTVDQLWKDRERIIRNAKTQIEVDNRLTQDLNSIHAHYRAKLCGDCCHVDVCGVSPSVKYGYECEDKAHPVGLAINIVDLSEPEPKKEEKQ